MNMHVIAGKQPDGTQGIATIELRTGNSDPIRLVGCVVHLSKKDKSLRNILKIDEEKNCKVNYFIFVPWFPSYRPTENITSIEVKLHRFRKEGKEKELQVDDNDISKLFEKYENDNYFVIPWAKRNFRNSSFFKKWSSKLLLHNNPNQVLQSSSLFHGFKKEETSDKTLFKYCGFDKGFDKLEEQGVLLIRQSIYESYVIGCYKKENGSIKKYCFLLKGLEEIADQEERGTNSPQDQPPPGRGEGGSNNPTPDQSPPGRGEGGSNNPTSDQHPSSVSEEGGDNPPLEQSPSTTAQESQGNPEPSQESEDGQDGSSELAAPRRQPSLHGSGEDESALKIKKKQLIHETYGPGLDRNHDFMHVVCQRLNPKQKVKGNDYRKLANKIGLDYYEIQSISARENPMEEVFEVMISRTIKVDKFIDILFEIERGDVVEKMYEMALLKRSQ